MEDLALLMTVFGGVVIAFIGGIFFSSTFGNLYLGRKYLIVGCFNAPFTLLIVYIFDLTYSNNYYLTLSPLLISIMCFLIYGFKMIITKNTKINKINHFSISILFLVSVIWSFIIIGLMTNSSWMGASA